MSSEYYLVKDHPCGCDCDGEGDIIVLKCRHCGSLIGGCSELDLSAYVFTKSEMKFQLNREDPYACPVCGSRDHRYATASEVAEIAIEKEFGVRAV